MNQSIDVLYDAFAAVPKPTAIDACSCCVDADEIATLLTNPLRDISPDELSVYASKVFLTVGAESDFRYFVPRIFEILATESGWWPDPEVVGRALANAGWQAWSATERAAVEGVFNAVFDGALMERDGCSLDSWLCAVAKGGMELTPFLQRMAASDEAVLALYLWHANEIMRGRLNNEFWQDVPLAAKALLAWFHSTEVSLLILSSCGVDLNLPFVPKP